MNDSAALRPPPPKTSSTTVIRKAWLVLLLSATAILAGALYSWPWLVALGVPPLLLGTLPCVAMCALGLCMNHADRRTRGKNESSLEQSSSDVDSRGSSQPQSHRRMMNK